jgi:hypothetical protein
MGALLRLVLVVRSLPLPRAQKVEAGHAWNVSGLGVSPGGRRERSAR